MIKLALGFLALMGLNAELIDIGDGRQIYRECAGTGTPSVIFISGRSDRADKWRTVFDAIAKTTHVCAYDRPGTIYYDGMTLQVSRSTSVPQPTTPKSGVADLHKLLKDVSPPYVLVAHSYGGLIARLYASTYPNEVAGLVLVDTLTEILFDSFTPEQQALWTRLNSNYSSEIDRYTVQERNEKLESFNQVRSASALKKMPVVVLVSDQPYDFKKLVKQGILPSDTPIEFESIAFKNHLKAQEELAKRLNAKLITQTHAGHYIQVEQPQLVIDAVLEVVDLVRKAKSQ